MINNAIIAVGDIWSHKLHEFDELSNNLIYLKSNGDFFKYKIIGSLIANVNKKKRKLFYELETVASIRTLRLRLICK